MITVYSAGIENETNVMHLFLGKKQNSLKAIHDDVSLCDCVNFKDVTLVIGCVTVGIEEMIRKIRLVKGVKCNECKEALKEIHVNFH